MNYELESKLQDKADKWEVQNLQQEIRNQNNIIDELRRKMGSDQSRMSNQVYVIQRLINLLIVNEVLKDNTHLLYDIQNTAY